MIVFKAKRSKVKFNVKSLDSLINNLLPRLIGTEVWFADLDDCDARSPAKRVVMNAVGTKHYSPKYLAWSLKNSYDIIRRRENKVWQDYVQTFLNAPESLVEMQNFLTVGKVRATVFEGVENFYAMLNSKKYYVTRNIETVARLYAKHFGFNGLYCEVNDKGKVVEQFILNNPWFKYYGCSGDSVEDEEMFDVLKFYSKKKKIDSAITLYCSKKIKDNVDIATTKDRTALVSVMAGYKVLPRYIGLMSL